MIINSSRIYISVNSQMFWNKWALSPSHLKALGITWPIFDILRHVLGMSDEQPGSQAAEIHLTYSFG